MTDEKPKKERRLGDNLKPLPLASGVMNLSGWLVYFHMKLELLQYRIADTQRLRP